MVALVGGISFERATGLDEVQAHLDEPDDVVWVDALDPTPAELSALMDLFGFHPLAMEDVAKGQQRAKLDEFKSHIFMVTMGVVRGARPQDFRTVEVQAFIGRNYLVTCHKEALPAIEEAQQRWAGSSAMAREGVGFLAYVVFDAIVDAYFPVVDAVEHTIEELEDAMVRGPSDKQVGELLDIRREVLRLRRTLSPMREALAQLLRRDRGTFSGSTQIYVHDVQDHLLRLLDLVEAQRDLVTSALDASLTIVSNRLNVTMKRLTIVSASVGFAAAVFGAWGMNFVDVPGAGSPWGFVAVVGGTIAVVAAGLAVVQRGRWI